MGGQEVGGTEGPSEQGMTSGNGIFNLTVITGRDLIRFSESTRGFRKRRCMEELSEFLHGTVTPRILILYGLRRTGKTTLMKQAILDMDESDLGRTAFIQARTGQTVEELYGDLDTLSHCGCSYVFIDEATLLDNFVEASAILADIYASLGMRIVLSGTDSLGFRLAEGHALFDRCIFIHTTVIPYGEFEEVLGIDDVDGFIEYGGTMCMGHGIDPGEYVDSAIARNIQHALDQYDYGGHFLSLAELRERNELTNVINRVIEDINHRFTIDVVTREFRSNDLSISVHNMGRDREYADALSNIDVESVTNRVKHALEIKNRDECSIEITENQTWQIRRYLEMLDVISEVKVRVVLKTIETRSRTLITQPGLRYSQACILADSVLEDEAIANLSLDRRRYVEKRIKDGIKGRMLEDIILFETKTALKDSEVFVLQFMDGEFDMVIADTGGCRIFEIKHSDKVVPQQYRHLVDAEKCDMTEYHFGKILERCVIYRGGSHMENGIRYINAEEYLRNLWSADL